MIRPNRLQPGDTIAIVSPSWGGPAVFPHRLEQGIQQLEALGYTVIIAPHAKNNHSWVSDTPENRAEDLMEMFANPQVKAIIASIGGDHSCQLLPLLDFDLIRRNPKIFMGFSDITVLNVAIAQATGLVTFNGPAVMTDFAEFPTMLEYTRAAFLRTVAHAKPAGTFQPSPVWTEEFLDWSTRADQTRPRNLEAAPGWTWLKPGRAAGRLLGGCIESLQHLRGTRFWPDWQGALFFFETSEEKPTPATVDGILTDYENMGILDQINGLLVGRPMSYTPKEREQLRQVILERTHKYHFPIITDMDFGHTTPQLTLPIGCLARIDSATREFSLIEAAVS